MVILMVVNRKISENKLDDNGNFFILSEKMQQSCDVRMCFLFVL